MTKDPLVPLRQIADAIEKIDRFTASGRSAFRRDVRTQDAVILNLALIGEAVKRLPPRVIEQFPEIEWNEIAKMRDLLIHHYEGTDLRVVWDTVEHSLPPLRHAVRAASRNAAA